MTQWWEGVAVKIWLVRDPQTPGTEGRGTQGSAGPPQGQRLEDATQKLSGESQDCWSQSRKFMLGVARPTALPWVFFALALSSFCIKPIPNTLNSV